MGLEKKGLKKPFSFAHAILRSDLKHREVELAAEDQHVAVSHTAFA